MRRSFVGVGMLLGIVAVCVAADAPALEKARKEYTAALAKAQADYNAAAERAAEVFKKKLRDQQEADTKAGKLDSAVAIRDEIKNLEDAAESATVAQVRRRLEGSVWQWTSDQVLQLNRDGTVTASWTKGAGRWYVNPDATVAWWVDSFPNVHIMRFNKALTEHKSFVPARPEFDRAGKRLK